MLNYIIPISMLAANTVCFTLIFLNDRYKYRVALKTSAALNNALNTIIKEEQINSWILWEDVSEEDVSLIKSALNKWQTYELWNQNCVSVNLLSTILDVENKIIGDISSYTRYGVYALGSALAAVAPCFIAEDVAKDMMDQLRLGVNEAMKDIQDYFGIEHVKSIDTEL